MLLYLSSLYDLSRLHVLKNNQENLMKEKGVHLRAERGKYITRQDVNKEGAVSSIIEHKKYAYRIQLKGIYWFDQGPHDLNYQSQWTNHKVTETWARKSTIW